MVCDKPLSYPFALKLFLQFCDLCTRVQKDLIGNLQFLYLFTRRYLCACQHTRFHRCVPLDIYSRTHIYTIHTHVQNIHVNARLQNTPRVQSCISQWDYVIKTVSLSLQITYILDIYTHI